MDAGCWIDVVTTALCKITETKGTHTKFSIRKWAILQDVLTVRKKEK